MIENIRIKLEIDYDKVNKYHENGRIELAKEIMEELNKKIIMGEKL